MLTKVKNTHYQITISQFINITKGVLYEQGNHYHQQHYTDLKTRIVEVRYMYENLSWLVYKYCWKFHPLKKRKSLHTNRT